MGKKFDSKLIEFIATGEDEEVLSAFCTFFNRIDITTDLVQDKESGLVTHQVMVIRCGDKAVLSTPLAYEWPLQPANVPEEAKEAGIAVIN